MNHRNPAYARLSFDPAGTPESAEFADIYFSRTGGLAESHYVFLQQNQLPARFQAQPEHSTFHLGETGFGTGLNVLLATREFLAHAPATAHLHITSFERYPLRPADLQRALAHWPELGELRATLQQQWPLPLPGLHRITLASRVTLDLILGDIRHTLPDWAVCHQAQTDAWFLDGFAPGKNPAMWQDTIYQSLVTSMKASASLATFTAAGQVRRGLQRVGLKVVKVPGFGRKREMLRAWRHQPAPPRPPLARQSLALVGGGIGAVCLAWYLRDHPGHLTWYRPALADGASGNPMGIVYPPVQAQWNPFTEFYSHAFNQAQQLYTQHTPDLVHWCGVQQLCLQAGDLERFRTTRRAGHYPENWLQGLTRAQASTGSPRHQKPALYWPNAGWLEAETVVANLAQQVLDYRQQHKLPTTVRASQVQQLAYNGGYWQVLHQPPEAAAAQPSAAYHQQVLLAAGQHNAKLLPQPLLPLRTVRGQITLVQANSRTQQLANVICHQGYLTPAWQGVHCLGATAEQGAEQATVRPADDQHNLEQANQHLQTNFKTTDILGQRAAIRSTTPDHLPVAGPVPRYQSDTGELSTWPGLYLLGGLGFRGFTNAPLAAAMVAAQLTGASSPAGHRVTRALEPARFARRALVKTGQPWSE